MASKPLTKFQRRAWITNTIAFAVVVAIVMYHGDAFAVDLAFPTVVYLVVVLCGSLLLRRYFRNKDERHFGRMLGSQRK